MTNGKDADRRAERPEDSRKGRRGTSLGTGRERQTSAVVKETSRPETTMLLVEVLRRENLITGYRKVRANKGAPGIDGMTVDDLRPHLTEHWPRIKRLVGNPCSPTGQEGRYTQTLREGNPLFRDTHRTRPVHPAGNTPDIDPDI